MTYIPEENVTAVAHQTTPRAILLFDKEGNLAETLDVSAVGSPSAIAYIPSRREFAVRVTEGHARCLLTLNLQLGTLNLLLSSVPVCGVGARGGRGFPCRGGIRR